MRYRAGSWMAAGVLVGALCQTASAHCHGDACAWWQNGAYGDAGCGHGACPALLWVKGKLHHFFYVNPLIRAAAQPSTSATCADSITSRWRIITTAKCTMP